jgi:hypothetical protein
LPVSAIKRVCERLDEAGLSRVARLTRVEVRRRVKT